MTSFDSDDFQTDIVDRSRQVPVLVDFWAAWCGPCRILGPLLERLADEADGRWVLAKVDTEKYPEQAAKHGIRGIPACKLFVDGRVVDEFVGAMPEASLRQWLERALPSPRREQLAMARSAVDRGDDVQARELLEPIARERPDDAEVGVLLARAELFDRPEVAQGLVAPISMASEQAEEAQAVEQLATLLIEEASAVALPEGRGSVAFAAGRAALRRRDLAGALDAFIRVLEIDRGYADGGARRACLALFRVLGEEHELTRSRRQLFSSALYA